MKPGDLIRRYDGYRGDYDVFLVIRERSLEHAFADSVPVSKREKYGKLYDVFVDGKIKLRWEKNPWEVDNIEFIRGKVKDYRDGKKI